MVAWLLQIDSHFLVNGKLKANLISLSSLGYYLPKLSDWHSHNAYQSCFQTFITIPGPLYTADPSLTWRHCDTWQKVRRRCPFTRMTQLTMVTTTWHPPYNSHVTSVPEGREAMALYDGIESPQKAFNTEHRHIYSKKNYVIFKYYVTPKMPMWIGSPFQPLICTPCHFVWESQGCNHYGFLVGLSQ